MPPVPPHGVGDREPDALTLEILATLARGTPAAEVAQECHVSERTLRRKLVEVRRAWGAGSTIESIVAAVRRGLI